LTLDAFYTVAISQAIGRGITQIVTTHQGEVQTPSPGKRKLEEVEEENDTMMDEMEGMLDEVTDLRAKMAEQAKALEELQTTSRAAKKAKIAAEENPSPNKKKAATDTKKKAATDKKKAAAKKEKKKK